MLRSLLRVGVLVVSFCVPSRLFASTITFEGLTEGDAVRNQFAGLTFSNATVLTSGAAGGTLNEIDFPPHSGDNVVIDDSGPIAISFTAPILSVSGYFTYNTMLTLTAYDIGHNVVDSRNSVFSSNLGSDVGGIPNELRQLTFAGGISSVVFAGDPFGGSFALDDVVVTTLPQATPVPEPGTFGLALLGGARLWIRRQRRQVR